MTRISLVALATTVLLVVSQCAYSLTTDTHTGITTDATYNTTSDTIYDRNIDTTTDTNSDTTSTLSPEGNFKHIIWGLMRRCPDHCTDIVERVMTRIYKDDVCRAISDYRSCTEVVCPDVSKSLEIIEVLAICAETTPAYRTTNDNALSVTPEGQIKQIIQELMLRCTDHCRDTGERALYGIDKDDICLAVETYQACTFSPCYSVSTSVELYYALDICEATTPSTYRTTTYTTSTAEGPIKQIIRELMRRCPDYCTDTGNSALSGTYKEDICMAVRAYRACTILPCYSVANSYELSEALAICATTTDAYSTTTDTISTMTPEDQTKVIIRELMARCPNHCTDLGMRVLNSHDTQDICMAVYEYRSCTYGPCQFASGFKEYFTIDMCGITTIAYSSTTDATARLSSEQHIKDIVTSVRAKCSNCHVYADTVLSRTYIFDICDAFYMYKACMLIPCLTFSRGSEMTLGKEICDNVPSTDTTTDPPSALTSEGHIQQIILGLMRRCPDHCRDIGLNVVALTYKDEICDAVRSYKVCTFLICHSVSTSYELSDALDICEEGNSCAHDKVSMLVLLLAVLVVHLFK